jgi:hypothetical protein
MLRYSLVFLTFLYIIVCNYRRLTPLELSKHRSRFRGTPRRSLLTLTASINKEGINIKLTAFIRFLFFERVITGKSKWVYI